MIIYAYSIIIFVALCLTDPSSYSAYPLRVDVPFTSSIADGYNPTHHNPPMNSHLAHPSTGPSAGSLTEFPSHGAIKVEQTPYPVHGEGLPNVLGMDTGVIPPPGLQDVVTHSVGPPAIVDSPMQEVPSQAENQVHPCISELLSSPHMLPCKPLMPYSSRLMFQFMMKTSINCRKKSFPTHSL